MTLRKRRFYNALTQSELSDRYSLEKYLHFCGVFPVSCLCSDSFSYGCRIVIALFGKTTDT
ncbi:hypothetical protein CTM62_06905 [Prevotella intermedia]|uniref:Uncharacterized protein n=1 Tax=Prevotella intermedia TaxID=28131 RepID=A0A2D3L7B2_PREIN|nr:hypothetical protein CTM62_06905 [Prevotella intermedia]